MNVSAEVPTEQQRGVATVVRADRAHAGVRALAENHAAGRAQTSLLQQTSTAPEARSVHDLLVTIS